MQLHALGIIIPHYRPCHFSGEPSTTRLSEESNSPMPKHRLTNYKNKLIM